MASNEGSNIAEWIDYHHSIGFDRFVIYWDRTVPVRDKMEEILQPYVKKGLVIVHDWTVKAAQTQALADCLNRYRDSTEWTALFDIDEFLVMPNHTRVADAMEYFADLAQTSVLSVPIWFYCNPDALTKQAGSIFDRLPYRLREGGWKAIIRSPQSMSMASFGPHFPQPISYLGDERKRKDWSYDLCKEVAGLQQDIHLRHYRWLSREEHVWRRMGPDSVFIVDRSREGIEGEWDKAATECRETGVFDPIKKSS